MQSDMKLKNKHEVHVDDDKHVLTLFSCRDM